MSESSKVYRPDIDGLRAVAVVLVILYHLDIPLFSGGFVGVDVFFVISGYLITGMIYAEVTNTGRFGFQRFYIRRFRRLFPALICTLIFSSIMAVALLSPARLSEYGGSLGAAVISVSNVYFWWLADYFDTAAQTKFLLHTWSLGVEEQFYLIWPALLVFGVFRAGSKRRIVWILLLGIFSLCLNPFYGRGMGGDWNVDGASTIFYWLPFRVFEFCIGASLALLPAPNSVFWERRADLLFVLGLSLILGSGVLFLDRMLFPSWPALIPCLGTALVIRWAPFSGLKWVLCNQAAVKTGLASYSLYLVHWPIIAAANYIGVPLSIPVCCIILALTWMLANLQYRYVETPFRHGNILKRPIRLVHGYMATMVATLVYSGFHMQQTGGWVWRIDQSVNFEEVKDAANFHREFYGGRGYTHQGFLNESKDPDTRADVVLMGDSHARQLAEGFFKLYSEARGYDVYSVSGTSCFHLDDVRRTTPGKDWKTMCFNALQAAKKKLSISPGATLVIAHSWVSQMQSAVALDGASEIKLSKEIIVQRLEALAKQFPEVNVLVIGNVPTPNGVLLYDYFSRPAFLNTILSRKPLEFARQKNSVIEAFNRYLEQASRSSGLFTFVDPLKTFCEDDICRVLDNQRRLIYSDGSHLSKYGSLMLVEDIILEPISMTSN